MTFAGSNFKWDAETRGEYRDRRKAEKASEQTSCYQAVDLRDHSICRVTGVFLTLGASDPKQRKERHHLIPRSRGGGHTTANVITISGFIHQQIHAGKVHLSGDANLMDADGRHCGVTLSRMTESGWKVERTL